MFKPLQNSERFKWVLLALVFQCSITTVESRALKSERSDVSTYNYLSGDSAIINGRLSLPIQIRNYRKEETLPVTSQNFKELFISTQKVKNSSQEIFQIPLKHTVNTRKWTVETPNFIPF